MSLAKKSTKWLVATVIVFALLLTAVFAVGNVATASATGEESTDIAAIVVADSVVDGTLVVEDGDLPITVTAKYYFELPNVTVDGDFGFAPILIQAGDEPTTIYPVANSVSFHSSIFTGVTTDVTAGERIIEVSFDELDLSTVAGVTVSDNVASLSGDTDLYIFEASFTVSAKGLYTFAFDNGTMFSLDEDLYRPVPEQSSFYVREVIDLPTAATDLVYDGTSKTGVADGDDYSVANGSKTDAGSYTAIVSLDDTDVTIWKLADDSYSIEDQEIPWSIAKKPITIPVSAGNTYTFNASEQTFEFTTASLVDADYITLANNVKTAAGDYTATATLKDTANYQWKDNTNAAKSYNWSIAKKSITVPESAGNTYTYNGQAQSFEFSEDPLTDAAYITITGTPQTAAGEYTVTAALTYPESTYWAADTTDTANKTYQFVISPILITVPTPADITYTYNGEEQSFQWASTPDALITITGTPQTNAGNYTITASIPANYAWNDEGHTTAAKTFPFVIAKVQITKPTPYDGAQYVYDSYNKQFMLDVVSAETGYYTVSNNIRRNAGTQNVTVSLKDKSNTQWADGTTADLEFTFTVQRRPVNISVSADAASHVYGNTPANVSISMTGAIDAFSCSYKVVCVDGEAPYAEYTPTQFNEGLNAGHYTLNPVYNDINGNYDVTVSEPFSYEVIKREITIPTAISGLEYTGSAQVGVTKTDAAFYELYSGSDEETAVGNYSATYNLKSTTNCYWAGDVTDVANKTVNWSIGKAQITKPSISASFKVYNGESQSYSGSGTGYTFTGSGTNAGDYPVTVSLTDKNNTVWAGTDSAADYSEADKLIIAKKTVRLTLTKSADSSVYGNSIATITAGINPDYAPINTADIGTLSYTAKNFQTNVIYTKAEFETIHTAPVGNYILTAVCSVDNDNYSVEGQTLPYEITKRPIEIPVLNQDDPSFVYNGSAQGISFFSGSLDGADYFTLSGTNSATNVGNYTYTATLNDATNCEWEDSTTAAKNYDWSITTLYITVPTVVDDTFTYDGNEHSIGFSNVDNDYVDITYDTQSAVGVYTDTTTVALKAAHAGNIAWDDEGHTTEAKAFTLTIENAYVHITYVGVFNNAEVTLATDVELAVNSALGTYDITWFAPTGYTFNNQAVTTATLGMVEVEANQETVIVYINYAYNVGNGDLDGDGFVTTADVLMLKLYYVDELDEEEDIVATPAAAWTLSTTPEADLTGKFFVSAYDVNQSGSFQINDITALRRALATGYGYSIVTDPSDNNVTGQRVIKTPDRVTVYTYQQLVEKVRAGYPVILGNDIAAAQQDYSETLYSPVDIDLGNYRLTVNSFTLTSPSTGVTLKIANGIIYTVEGITVTAPAGNVIVNNVNGYTYENTEVILAAYTSSLHIESNVAFYQYKVVGKETAADYKATVNAEDAIEAVADARIEATEQAILDMEEKKAEHAALEAEKQTLIDNGATEEEINQKIDEANAKQAEIDAIDVFKAPVSIPVDTHVVVEENASLTVEKVTVTEAAGADENVSTFSINVKNTEAAAIAVDITEVKDDSGVDIVYHVEELEIAGAASKVTVISNEEQNQTYTLKSVVAQIGSTNYYSLQEAIDAAQNGDTITLVSDVADGTGLKTADNDDQNTKVGKTFTIDFNGKTYTVDGASVGSSGTETQAMHWGAKDTITLKNGTFVISVNAATVPNPTNNKVVKMAMQNYANLTVKNMTMDFSNIDLENYPTYTGKYAAYSGLEIPLFNLNEGSLTIEDNTTITMPNDSTKGILIEIPNAATIKNSTINGYVSLGQANSNVTIINSTVTGGVVSYFAGYAAIDEGNVYSLVSGVGVKTAAELQAALNAGASHIYVLDDFTASQIIMVYSSVVIEGRGHTLTSTAGRTLQVTASTPANSVVEIKDYSLINTCLSANGNVRGVQFNIGVNYVTLILDNARVEARHYALNFTPGSSNDTIIIRNGSYIKGWAAINSYLNNSTFNVQDSTLHGVNYTDDHTYAFNVITFDSQGLDGVAHGTYGSNNVVNIERSTVYAETTYTNEYWVNTQYGAMNNVINVDAATQLIDANNDDIVAFFRLGNAWNSGTILYSYYPNAVRMPLTAEQLAAVEANPNFMVKSLGNNIYEITSAIRTVRNETELNAALADGVKYIILNADIEVTETIVVDYATVLNMNGKTLYNVDDLWEKNAGDWSIISVRTEDGDLTIVGDGTISAKQNDCYAIDVQDGATLDIEDGTYIGNVSVVYIYNGGHVTISGGEYSLLQLWPDERYLLNCLDDDYTAGTANFTVTGGTFHGFNPADNASEGANTNYLADGYVAVEEGGVWTVVPNEIEITTFAELKAAIADVNAGNIVYPTLIIANDIQFEEELTISKSVYIMGDGEVKFIGYDASTKYDEAFYINVADEDQEITIDGIVFDHFCYYSNVANKTKATASAVKNGVAYITYGGDCPASTNLYITGCQFLGTARDMINASSTKGCKGFIAIEDCFFDATDRLSSTLNMLSFYGNADAELYVMITGCTFKEASEQNATWATSAIASFGNADITVVGCEFIACQIGIAIDNTFDRLYSTSTYPVYYNTTVNLVENTYTNCYFGYFGEFFVEDASEIPEGAELSTDEPFTYGDAEATQFHFAAEYDVYEAGEEGEAQHRIYLCYYVLDSVGPVGGNAMEEIEEEM